MSTICSIVCRGCLILTFVVIQGVWSPLCAQEDEQESVYTVVKQMPMFQGGDLNAFRNWVQRELHHPTNADEKQITGRVICNFIIEKDGSVGDVGVLQSPDSLLVSLFCNTYCQRKSRPIHTKVINDILQPEFSEAPENINYNLDFWERGLSDEQKEQLRTEGIQEECVVLRKHQTRASEAFVACDACNGTGRLKCPACGGSGREQYVDSYYASGEERIKTGSCSECQGHGQVPCPDCQGQGRIEIFSQNYTVEKSVTETWKQHTVIAYNSPSIGWNCRVVLFADYDDANDESLFNLPHYDFDCEEYDSGKKAVQDAVSDNDCIRLKMKNRKEILEDNTCAYDEAMQRFGLLAAYKTNCEYADSSPMTPEGELVCRQERHYIIPVTRLRIHTHRIGDEESDDIPFVAYIFPYDNVTDWVCVDRKFIDGDTSKLEYFFTKLFKKSNL